MITGLELLADAIFTSLDILCVFGTVIPTHSKDFFRIWFFNVKVNVTGTAAARFEGTVNLMCFRKWLSTVRIAKRNGKTGKMWYG